MIPRLNFSCLLAALGLITFCFSSASHGAEPPSAPPSAPMSAPMSAIVNRVSGAASEENPRSRIDSPTTSAMREEVWRLVLSQLRTRDLPERRLPQATDLDLPASLPPLGARRLHVVSACWDRAALRTQFRLECDAPGECLPFLVYIHGGYLHDGYLHDGYLHDIDRHAHSQRHIDAPVSLHQASMAEDAVTRDSGSPENGFPFCRPTLELRHSTSAIPGAVAGSVKPVITVGERATAVFVSSNLRMSATVICLERGRAGDVIRVRNQNGQILRARVSGPALLEAVPQ